MGRFHIYMLCAGLMSGSGIRLLVSADTKAKSGNVLNELDEGKQSESLDAENGENRLMHAARQLLRANHSDYRSLYDAIRKSGDPLLLSVATDYWAKVSPVSAIEYAKLSPNKNRALIAAALDEWAKRDLPSAMRGALSIGHSGRPEDAFLRYGRERFGRTGIYFDEHSQSS